MSARRRNWIAGLWGDVGLATVLAVLAFAMTMSHARLLGDTVTLEALDSSWFQADTYDFYPMVSGPDADHRETRVHPLFSMFVSAPTLALSRFFGLNPLHAFQTIFSLSAAAWSIAILALFRIMGCRRSDAVVLSLLALASSAAQFWFAVPESYPFGSITILLVLIVAALSAREIVRERWFVVVSAASLSMTVTNWMLGILLSMTRLPWRRALQVTVNALCVVVLLWAAQKAVFPSSEFFLDASRTVTHKSRFLFHPRAGGPVAVTQSFFFHSMVVPEIVERPDAGSSLRLVTQRSMPGSGGPLAVVAVLAWAGLLALGVWSMVSNRERQVPLRQLVAWSLAGQLILHLMYGDETFLYSLHFIPLLLVVAAFGLMGRHCRLAWILALVLMISAGIHNHGQFKEAAGLLQTKAAAAH